MMKKFLISIMILSIFIDSSFAQVALNYNQLFPDVSTVSEVGFNQVKLQRIDAGFQELIAREQIPGAVALVIRNGKVVYEKAFGISDPKTNRAFKIDDIFANKNEIFCRRLIEQPTKREKNRFNKIKYRSPYFPLKNV